MMLDWILWRLRVDTQNSVCQEPCALFPSIEYLPLVGPLVVIKGAL